MGPPTNEGGQMKKETHRDRVRRERGNRSRTGSLVGSGGPHRIRTQPNREQRDLAEI